MRHMVMHTLYKYTTFAMVIYWVLRRGSGPYVDETLSESVTTE